MAENKRLVPVVIASGVVIAAVIAVIAMSLIPFPEYPELGPGTLDGELAFVDQDNCVFVADLKSATARELVCESERTYVEFVEWTEEGIEVSTYVNGPTIRVIDPATGDTVSTRSENEFDREPRMIDRGFGVWEDGEMILRSNDDAELLRIEAPEAYRIDMVVEGPEGTYAFTDSRGQLVVLEQGRTAWLVAENVREYGSVAWAP